MLESVGEQLEAEDMAARLDYTASPNDNVIIEGIAANPTSLGWVGFAFVEENLDVVKPLAVDGGAGCVEPTPETIASGEFPIARNLFIYVNAAKADENPALAAFVDYYVTDGRDDPRRSRRGSGALRAAERGRARGHPGGVGRPHHRHLDRGAGRADDAEHRDDRGHRATASTEPTETTGG